ncbi:MAG: hypothetical protein JWO94_1924 [Verrucomicrobiaceae bacterium]|nr:hypothetical protein [Verrucomicrobiaceae bacterium]
MATNVRRKAPLDRSAQALARSPDITHVAAPARRRRNAVEEAEEVRRRIEHLECVITTAPAEHAARRVAMRDMVPPSDDFIKRKPARARRRPMQVQARSHQRSMGLLVQSVILAVVIAGVAGWLNQRFHFLSH